MTNEPLGSPDGSEPSAVIRQALRRLLPPHVDVTAWPEYELRHPTGEVDTFKDIGDASDFRDSHFPNAKLFRREVTAIEIRSPWEDVDSEDDSGPSNVVAFARGDEA